MLCLHGLSEMLCMGAVWPMYLHGLAVLSGCGQPAGGSTWAYCAVSLWAALSCGQLLTALHGLPAAVRLFAAVDSRRRR